MFIFLGFHQCPYSSSLSKALSFHQLPSSLSLDQIKLLDTWEPIRITFDFQDLYNEDVTCQYLGQIVQWASNEKNACVKGDLKDENKIAILKETLDNVRIYLNKLLEVHPYGTIALERNYVYYPVTPSSATNTDLFISVYARPFGSGSSTLASAASIPNEIGKRPWQGFMNINFNNFPSQSSNISDRHRSLFETLLHETIHALGFSSDHYKNFINPQTNLPYGTSPTTHCSDPDTGRSFDVLTTPNLVKFVSDRFNIQNNEFFSGCPVGLQLENYGGSGSAGSHPELLIYFTEVMAPITIDYSYISNLTLNLLLDTGWYHPDFSMAEALPWGDHRSRAASQPWSDFPTKSPAISFPEDYIAKYKLGSTPYCSYDLNAIVYSNVQKYVKGETDLEKFFDPYDTGLCGKNLLSQFAENVPMKQPYSDGLCFDLTTSSDRGIKGDYSKCFAITQKNVNSFKCLKTHLFENGTIQIQTLNQNTLYCNESGTIFQDGDIKYHCPDIKATAALFRLVNFTSPEIPWTPFGGKIVNGKEIGIGMIIGFTIFGIILLLVIVGIIGSIYHKKQKKKNLEVSF